MGDHQTLAPLVRKLATRAPLTTIEKDALLGLPFRIRSLGRDGYMAREGARSDHSQLLLSGMAYEQKWTGAGAKQILALHLPGDLIAMSSALLPTSDHDARALNAVTFAEIPRDALIYIARSHPGIAHALWMQAMVDASIHREWIVNVGRRNARQRIAHLLCELSFRSEANGLSAASEFQCPLTQDHIADSIGATPVHVNRILKGMRMEGLVKSARLALSVPDLNALQSVGEFNPAYLHLGRPDR